MTVATISKDFHFSASHRLDGLVDGHQCGRLHGHNYVVRAAVSGLVDDRVGFVLDYGELKPFGTLIDDYLDHRHLNDVLPFNPTAELMAEWLATEFQRVVLSHQPASVGARIVRLAISVSETPKTWATFEVSL